MDNTQFTATQPSLIELRPSLGIPLGRRLHVLESDGQRAVFIGATSIHVYDAQDRAAEAAALALLAHAGVATQGELAAAFGCHRNTVGRLERRLAHGGMAEVAPAKRGPRGPHKVTPTVLAVVREFASVGRVRVARAIAQRTGVRSAPEETVVNADPALAQDPGEPPVALPAQARGR